MKHRLSFVAFFACLVAKSFAAVPTPEQLLPADTLAVVTIPDCVAAWSAWDEQAAVRLWHDPAMGPFREKLAAKWRGEVLEPIEAQLGLRLAEQARLLQGQLTVAVVANGWPETAGKTPAWLLTIDTRDQAPSLADRLTEWKVSLAEAGRKTRTENLRDHAFTAVEVQGAGLADLLGMRQAAEATRPTEVWFGQSGSMLWVGDQQEVLEQALARQVGDGGPPLMANPDFATSHASGVGSAQANGWLHLKPLVDFISGMDFTADGADGGAMAMLQPSKVLPALGLQGLRSVSFTLDAAPAGTTAQVRVGIPEPVRTGLFRMILPGRKEAGPPAFVPADIARYQRMRVDLQGAWLALEGVVYSILPTARSVVDLMFQSVGKDRDPNYDLRKELIGNLGDDVIVVEHQSVTNSLAALNAAPALFLIGADSPEKVAGALKILTTLFPPPMNALRQRQVEGRTVYSLELTQEAGAGGGSGGEVLHFAAGTGYLALSGDVMLLHRFLEGTGPTNEPLAALEGLDKAAEAVGGMNNGWFGYENDRVMARTIIDALRADSSTLEGILALTPAGGALVKSGGLKAWTDFSLLPPFEQISRYFHFSVYGLDLRREDFGYRMYSPTPPGLQP